MSRWFRFYDEALDNPKIIKLSDKTYRVWGGILCAASKNDGILPPFDDLVIMLRMKPDKLQPEIEKLIAAELIDHDDNGMRPHNWNKRQYKSDVSTERVKRFRNAERNVSETPPETEQIQNRTEKKKIETNEDFEKLKAVYPKRKGANPWKPACAVFLRLVGAGVDPQEIIDAARDGIGLDRDKAGTEFIPQLVKWLKDERFRDRPGPLIVVASGFYVAADTPQMDAWLLYEREAGKSYPRDRNGGWHFPTEWPPGHKMEAA